ncbi:MAG: hypothetical protein MJ217_02960 [Bacilli bacterium]|nr:hypothetical protein [Bacilli bacterium]
MSDIKNVRLKNDIRANMDEREQELVLGILSEIETKGTIDGEVAKRIGSKAFEG